VLRGNVARAAGNVIVNVQLIRGDTDQIVWAKPFRSDANGAAASRSEIAAGVTTALKTTVSPEEKALLSRAPTTSAEAFELYLRQREILIQKGFGSPATRQERQKLLEEAVTREEAVALARLAGTSVNRTIISGMVFAASGDQEGTRTCMATAIAARQKERASLVGPALVELAVMQGIGGDRAGALATAAEIERFLSDMGASGALLTRVRLASVHAWTGDKDRALRELTRLLHVPGQHLRRDDGGDDYWSRINVHELRSCLEFSPLQGDPRFEALLNDPKNNEPLF
jgi:hypothetical protein